MVEAAADNPTVRRLRRIAEGPVTSVIVLCWVAAYAALWMTRNREVTMLAFYPVVAPPSLFTPFLYPLAIGDDPFLLVISVVLLLAFGRGLERRMGSGRYLGFLLFANLAALALWQLGAWWLLGGCTMLDGPWFMLAAVAAAWAWSHPTGRMSGLPVGWLAWLAAALLVVLAPLEYGPVSPAMLLLGIFTLGGVAVAALYARVGWLPR